MTKLVIDLDDQSSIEMGIKVLDAITGSVEVSNIKNVPPVVSETTTPLPAAPLPVQEVPTPVNISVKELNDGMVKVFGRLGSRTAIDAVLATYDGATSISTIDPSLYGELLVKVNAL